MPGISRNGVALLGFSAIAAFFLFAEHRAHLLGALPYVLLLLCPFLHLFGHGGHGGGAGGAGAKGHGHHDAGGAP